jgi:hypothetical protein
VGRGGFIDLEGSLGLVEPRGTMIRGVLVNRRRRSRRTRRARGASLVDRDVAKPFALDADQRSMGLPDEPVVRSGVVTGEGGGG